MIIGEGVFQRSWHLAYRVGSRCLFGGGFGESVGGSESVGGFGLPRLRVW